MRTAWRLPRTTIATFDVLGNDAGPAATKTLFSGGAIEVYSTRDSLYIFGRSNNYSATETTIQKFDFDSEDHSIKLAAKGSVAGTLLNQFAACAVNRPVVAGPVEATSVGNVLMQMLAAGDLADLREGREMVARSFATERYEPEDADAWSDAYSRFKSVEGKS